MYIYHLEWYRSQEGAGGLQPPKYCEIGQAHVNLDIVKKGLPSLLSTHIICLTRYYCHVT